MKTVWIMEIKNTYMMEFDVQVFESEYKACEELKEYVKDIAEEDLVYASEYDCEVKGKDGFNTYMCIYEKGVY